jgi:hypothetical protein
VYDPQQAEAGQMAAGTSRKGTASARRRSSQSGTLCLLMPVGTKGCVQMKPCYTGLHAENGEITYRPAQLPQAQGGHRL